MSSREALERLDELTDRLVRESVAIKLAAVCEATVPIPDEYSFVATGDVSVSASPRDANRVGRRFNFDVSEEVLSEIGRHALEHAVVRMGEQVAGLYRAEVKRGHDFAPGNLLGYPARFGYRGCMTCKRDYERERRRRKRATHV